MEDKYYTPELSEFHVGFEYESFDSRWQYYLEHIGTSDDGSIQAKVTSEPKVVKGWYKNTYDGTDFISSVDEEIRLEIDLTPLRVKYLSREDIESFGFDNYIPPMEYNHSWNFKGGKEPKLYVWFNNKIPVVRIYSSFPAILFQGEIKNKSEFSRLLRQLSII